jgi:3-dehydroquinate synthetase
MRQDKKVAAGKMALILVRGIGEAFVSRDVPGDALRSFLVRQAARPRP